MTTIQSNLKSNHGVDDLHRYIRVCLAMSTAPKRPPPVQRVVTPLNQTCGGVDSSRWRKLLNVLFFAAPFILDTVSVLPFVLICLYVHLQYLTVPLEVNWI